MIQILKKLFEIRQQALHRLASPRLLILMSVLESFTFSELFDSKNDSYDIENKIQEKFGFK